VAALKKGHIEKGIEKGTGFFVHIEKGTGFYAPTDSGTATDFSRLCFRILGGGQEKGTGLFLDKSPEAIQGSSSQDVAPVSPPVSSSQGSGRPPSSLNLPPSQTGHLYLPKTQSAPTYDYGKRDTYGKKYGKKDRLFLN
jgi:hypothetical protein